jgi:RepB DNA-primase from phage plasmid
VSVNGALTLQRRRRVVIAEEASIAHFPSINREEAQRFLNILDNRTDRFTFQTFDDDGDRKNRRLVRTLHGTLEQHFATLVNLNRRGAGAFITINSTNFKGRSTECIVEVRCYFADLDGAPLENIACLGLKPLVITETSPKRFHVFYKIKDAPLSQEHFKRTQQGLATLFGSDPKVCDLPRVMRLPGFVHQKDPANPFITRIVWVRGE